MQEEIEKKNKIKSYSIWMLFIFIVIAFISLLILPKDFFDYGKPICISVNLFHRECYACGMTRAVQHLIHLDFKGAATYNKLSFIVLPLLIYAILWEFYRFWKKNK